MYSRKRKRTSNKGFKYRKRRRIYKRRVRAKRRGVPYISRPRKNFLPNSCYVKLVYCENLYTTDASSPRYAFQFTGNSLFAPQTNGTGHQPRGFDQLTPIYGEYRVLGCKFQFIINNIMDTEFTSPPINPQLDVIIFFSDQGLLSQPANFDDACEIPNSYHVRVPYQGQRKFKKYVSSKYVLGKHRTYADQNIAIYTDNPGDPWYCYIWFYSAQTHYPVLRFECACKLTYYAHLTGKILVGPS